MIVKVCGMSRADNIRDVEALGIDLMGFIFYPRSPRFVRSMPAYLPRVRRVGVFVNAAVEEMAATAARWGLWAVQLHGSESPDVCSALRARGLRVIKAFGVGEGLPDHLGSYGDCCDMFLFDTACASHGGSGLRFDWNVLKAYAGSTPFLLSGGIGPDSVAELSRFEHPGCVGIDINSAFEISPGVKDASLIGSFLEKIRYCNPNNEKNE